LTSGGLVKDRRAVGPVFREEEELGRGCSGSGKEEVFLVKRTREREVNRSHSDALIGWWSDK